MIVGRHKIIFVGENNMIFYVFMVGLAFVPGNGQNNSSIASISEKGCGKQKDYFVRMLCNVTVGHS